MERVTWNVQEMAEDVHRFHFIRLNDCMSPIIRHPAEKTLQCKIEDKYLITRKPHRGFFFWIEM